MDSEKNNRLQNTKDSANTNITREMIIICNEAISSQQATGQTNKLSREKQNIHLNLNLNATTSCWLLFVASDDDDEDTHTFYKS